MWQADSCITIFDTLCLKYTPPTKISRNFYSLSKESLFSNMNLANGKTEGKSTSKSGKNCKFAQKFSDCCKVQNYCLQFYCTAMNDQRLHVEPEVKNHLSPNMEVIIRKNRLIYAKNGFSTNQKLRPPEVRRKEGRSSVLVLNCDRFRVMLVENFTKPRFFLFLLLIECAPWYSMSGNRKDSTNSRPVSERFS